NSSTAAPNGNGGNVRLVSGNSILIGGNLVTNGKGVGNGGDIFLDAPGDIIIGGFVEPPTPGPYNPTGTGASIEASSGNTSGEIGSITIRAGTGNGVIPGRFLAGSVQALGASA